MMCFGLRIDLSETRSFDKDPTSDGAVSFTALHRPNLNEEFRLGSDF